MADLPPVAGLRCPVCRAAIGSGKWCGRCKADVSPILKILLAAHRFRETARNALIAGDQAAAIPALNEALRLQEHPGARKFLLLARILSETPANPPVQSPSDSPESPDSSATPDREGKFR